MRPTEKDSRANGESASDEFWGFVILIGIVVLVAAWVLFGSPDFTDPLVRR